MFMTSASQLYAEADKKCVNQYSPDGPGNCTTGELFQNEENRKRINECVSDSITQELTDDEKEEMENFVDCVKNLGEKCPGKNN
ncbi:hypothetical protein NPIL_399261 [Nephila pilipes]|uniref:Uncharacterized protein n=1 Tax=Nephila pilipes TaxID=299642 RepID=A0A8X6MHT0_NEPPI|nr:hypothetical protein NPIL_399261 [Nephila pilipes]